MLKTISQIAAGATGFVATVADVTAQTTIETVNQVKPTLENPDTYIKGLIVSGAIQIIMKLIDKWSERRKAKKAEKVL